MAAIRGRLDCADRLAVAVASSGVVLILLLSTAALGAPLASISSGPATMSSDGNSTVYIHHVVLVVLENEQLPEVWAHGNYERYLAATYGNATQFYAACHPSASNYLDMISAETNQCGSDNWNNYTERTLGNELTNAGLSWAAYAESLPSSACSSPGTSTAGMFAVRHVPFLYFANVTRNTALCHTDVLSSSVFNSSVANGTLPTFSFYTPNLCDDGHNGCGGNTTDAQLTMQADSWLRDFLSPMLNHTGRYGSAAEQTLISQTAFMITWDEGTGSNAGFAVAGVTSGNNYNWCQANNATGDAVCGGHIYFAVVSPYSLARKDPYRASDPSVAATVEWLFGLKHLRNSGDYDSLRAFGAMKQLFSFKSNGYP